MSEEDLYSSGKYAAQNESLHEEDVEWKLSTLNQAIDRIAIEIPQGSPLGFSLIDVGGGTGGIASGVIARLGKSQVPVKRLYCLDPSPECLESQRKRFSRTDLSASYENGTLPSDMPNEQFDIALLIHVVEHIDDYGAALEKVAARCKYLIIQIPLQGNLFELALNTLTVGWYRRSMRETIGHLHFFGPWEAKREFSKYGEVIYCDFPDVNRYFLNSHYNKTMPFWFLIQSRFAVFVRRLSLSLSLALFHNFMTVVVRCRSSNVV